MQWMEEIQVISTITIIDLDESLAEVATESAANYHLRGSDAIYAAVATRIATQLVTVDSEQIERVKKVVKVRRPRKDQAIYYNFYPICDNPRWDSGNK